MYRLMGSVQRRYSVDQISLVYDVNIVIVGRLVYVNIVIVGRLVDVNIVIVGRLVYVNVVIVQFWTGDRTQSKVEENCAQYEQKGD